MWLSWSFASPAESYSNYAMSRKRIGNEMLQNMELTREQYENACALIDELHMERGDFKKPLSEWEQIQATFGEVI